LQPDTAGTAPAFRREHRADAPSGGAIMADVWVGPPDWFSKKDYHYLCRLDASGWLQELQRCNALQKKVDLSEWESIGKQDWTKKFIPAYIGPPAVEVVAKADQAALRALEKPALIVQVSLRAPDSVIIGEFKKALQAARCAVPPPVRTRGSRDAPAAIGNMHFNTWISHKIVEFCEIEAWRDGLEGTKPSDADIGRWLFSNYAAPPRRLSPRARPSRVRSLLGHSEQ
jgi:hypothetical protein